MIRAFFLFAAALLIFSPATKAQFRIGPKAGIQLSRAAFAEAEDKAAINSYFKPGLRGGLQMNYRVNKLYSLQSEVLFSQTGRHVKSLDDYANEVENKATHYYLNLPIMLRLSGHKLMGKNHVEYYANIGPSFNYWLGGRGKISSDEIYEFTFEKTMPYTIRFSAPEEDSRNKMYVENPQRLQMSLDFGGGAVFDLGYHNHISVDVRSSLGIGKTYMGAQKGGDYGLFSYYENLKAVNHVLAVSVGYLRDFDLMMMLSKGKTTKGKVKRR